jgi:hypothetical protein
MPVKDCCLPAAGNLRVTEKRDDLTVNTCKVCGSRHFRLQVEPGRLGLKFNQEGSK